MFRALKSEVESDRRLAIDPLTWRFIAGQLGGRRIRDNLRPRIPARRSR
jgi:hypothetical protein